MVFSAMQLNLEYPLGANASKPGMLNFTLQPNSYVRFSYYFTTLTGATEGVPFADLVMVDSFLAQYDPEPPTFPNCPNNMHVSNDPDASVATITWSVPDATDNIGVVQQTATVNPPLALAIGSAVVATYQAWDANGNKV